MDSTESPVHGQQEGSAYNGHFESVCYHPLLLFNQHGDCSGSEAASRQRAQRRRSGTSCYCRRSNDNRQEGKQVAFRGDAAFAKPEIYERWRSAARTM